MWAHPRNRKKGTVAGPSRVEWPTIPVFNAKTKKVPGNLGLLVILTGVRWNVTSSEVVGVGAWASKQRPYRLCEKIFYFVS